MMKYGIFLVNGQNHNYAGTSAIGLNKLHIADFDTIEEAEVYLEENPISTQYLIMQFWIK